MKLNQAKFLNSPLAILISLIGCLIIPLTFLPPPVQAKILDSTSNAGPQKFRAEDIAKLSPFQLQDLWTEINRLHNAVNLAIDRGGSPYTVSKAIDDLKQIEVQESVDLLTKILTAEAHRHADPKMKNDPAGPDLEIISAALKALEEIGTKNDVRTEDDKAGPFDAVHDKLRHILVNQGFGAFVTNFAGVDQLSRTRNAMLRRRDPLPSLGAILHDSRGVKNVVEYLKRMETSLRDQILEDEPTVKALARVMADTFLDGPSNRRTPEKITLMGPTATGKTHAGRSLTNAIFDDPEAYKEHMFEFPLLKQPYDEAKIMGSSVGLIGSDKFPAFLEFAVRHLDGMYLPPQPVERPGQGTVYKIVKNPDYKGKTLPGFFPPWMAVVLVDEFGDVSAQHKNDFYKLAIQDGKFILPSPNGGEYKIEAPFNFLMATNEGAELISGRDVHESGEPQTYEDLKARWEVYSKDPEALADAMLATNQKGRKVGGQGAPGISQEMVNRLKSGYMLLMQPASPKRLQLIVERALKNLAKNLKSQDSALANILGTIDFEWDPNIPITIQQYDYNPEDNARPVEGLFKKLIREPLISALMNDKFKSGGQAAKVHVSLKKNDDLTMSLVIEVTPTGENAGEPYSIEQPIAHTEKDHKKEPISDSRIQEILAMGDTLRSRIFGMDDTVDKVVNWLLTIENEMNSNKAGKAKVILIDGLSSTGKSQLAKELHRILFPREKKLPVFDFTQVKSEDDMRREFLGYDRGDHIEPSRFMKLYDFHRGRIVVELGELPNTHPELIKHLYSFFRDEWVQFPDKARDMSKVVFIVTGNATLDEYSQIPKNLPLHARMQAYQSIYDRLKNNYPIFYGALAKKYPDPALNRVGKVNAIVSRPHTYKSLRELVQLKIGEALKSLWSGEDSVRGAKVVFNSVDEYKDFVDRVIEEGFVLDEQGASVENYIKAFRDALSALLLRASVPTNANVILRFREATDNHDADRLGKLVYDVFVPGRTEPLTLKMDRLYVEYETEPDDIETILTAWHEAGHEIGNIFVFGDTHLPFKVSIVDGVAQMGDKWVYYDGIAIRAPVKQVPANREFVIRTVAMALGGYAAELYASGDHAAGKANDIERAKHYLREGFVRGGLADEWGINPPSMGEDMEQFLNSLSSEKKDKLNGLVEDGMNEALSLIYNAIVANAETMNKFANLLLDKRELNKRELEAFHKENPVKWLDGVSTKEWVQQRKAEGKWHEVPKTEHQFPRRLKKGIVPPARIANLKDFLEARKHAEYELVPLPENPPIATKDERREEHVSVSQPCEKELE